MYAHTYIDTHIYIYIHDRWRVGPPPCHFVYWLLRTIPPALYIRCCFPGVFFLGVYMLYIKDYIPLHRENSGRRHFGGSWKAFARQLVGFRRYLRPKTAWDGSWAALGRLWGALGRLLGGSGEALGRLLEASRRHLGAEAVIARTLFS